MDDDKDTPNGKEKRTNRFIERAVNMQMKDIAERDALRFVSRVLVQAAFPHRKPDTNEWHRQNGNISVRMWSAYGLPYGSYPRLMMAWMTTEAVRNKARISGPEQRRLELGHSLSAFMADLDIRATGGRNGTVGRFTDQLKRLVSSAIVASHEHEDADQGSLFVAPQTVAQKAHLFWDTRNPDQGVLWGSYIELSEPFYELITDRPVPVDMDMLRAIKQSPLAVDLYCWLTYRVSYLRKPTIIPWHGLMAQFGSNYQNTPRGVRDFRAAFKKALTKVYAAWPELSVESTQKGLRLKPCSAHVNKLETKV